MKTNELITSGVLEAYALGIASPEEVKWVEAELSNPEIQQELLEIEQALFSVATKLEKDVPSSVKANLDKLLFAEESELSTPIAPKVIDLPQSSNSSGTSWMRIAAGLALLISVAANVMQYMSYKDVKQQMAALEQSNTILAGEVQVVRQDLDFYGAITDFFQRGDIKMVELTAVNDRQGKAMVYCDMKSGQIAIKPSELPAIDNEHQYQLWALVDGKPVDMGMIPNDMVGKEQMAMLKSGHGMQAFAITKEPYGGRPEPTLTELVVMGKLS